MSIAANRVMATNLGKAVLKTVLATGAFAAVHSLFASRAAKRTAADLFGTANVDGWYRVAYIAQSLVTAGLLVDYLRRQPSIPLYHVRGPTAALMHVAQAAGLAHATLGARQVGILRITGVENLTAWLRNQEVPPMPEAQGPAFSDESANRISGPFALSRHPLNLSPLPVLWLWPRMNSTLLTFNVASTIYLIVGSLHEEARLLEVEGASYEAYRESGVPFYRPVLRANPLRTITALRKDAHYQDAT